MEMIGNIKVGDPVLQIERSANLPTSSFEWNGVVVSKGDKYIDVVFRRHPTDFLELARHEMKAKSKSNIDRTYFEIFIRNFVGDDGFLDVKIK